MSGAIVMISTFNANGRAINYLGNNYDNGRPIGSAKSQHSSELSSTPPIRQTINKKGPNTMTNSLSPANLVAWCTAFFCAQVTESAPTFTVSKTRGGTMSAARPASLALLAVILAAVIAFVAVDETRAQAVFGLAVTADTRSSAEATVTVTGADSIHLRFRLTGTTEWTTLNAATASANDTEVEFTLNGLTPNAVYEVEASQADNFPATDATVSVTFVNRPSEQDLQLTNWRPRGLWANSNTVWVGNDSASAKLFAYQRSDGERDEAKDFPLDAAGNDDPKGIWSDGDTMFVVDNHEGKIFAYAMSDKAQATDQEIALSSSNRTPAWGLWADDETFWVVNYDRGDDDNNRVYAYSRTAGDNYGDEDPSQGFSLRRAGNDHSRGIWSDGYTIWVVDIRDAKLYAYDKVSKERLPDQDIPLDADNTEPKLKPR